MPRGAQWIDIPNRELRINREKTHQLLVSKEPEQAAVEEEEERAHAPPPAGSRESGWMQAVSCVSSPARGGLSGPWGWRRQRLGCGGQSRFAATGTLLAAWGCTHPQGERSTCSVHPGGQWAPQSLPPDAASALRVFFFKIYLFEKEDVCVCVCVHVRRLKGQGGRETSAPHTEHRAQCRA